MIQRFPTWRQYRSLELVHRRRGLDRHERARHVPGDLRGSGHAPVSLHPPGIDFRHGRNFERSHKDARYDVGQDYQVMIIVTRYQKSEQFRLKRWCTHTPTVSTAFSIIKVPLMTIFACTFIYLGPRCPTSTRRRWAGS